MKMFSRLCTTILRNKQCTNHVRNLITVSTNHCDKLNTSNNFNHVVCRHKSKSKKLDKRDESDTGEDSDGVNQEEEVIDKYTKIMNVKVGSLRADILLKVGLGIARSKIETMIYESKVRLNGEKLLKKSAPVNEGDEIDLIKSFSPANPDFLIVARVELLSVGVKGEAFAVRLKRCKSLTIENYKQPWKG